MIAASLTRHRPADNPFASHRVEALPYRGLEDGCDDLGRRIDDLGGRAAIVGPKGSGKTTLLEGLGDRLPTPVILIRVPGGDPRPYRTALRQLPDPVTAAHTILVDGVEQLGPLAWPTFLNRTRKTRRLVATLHRPGRLPTLVECATDCHLLLDLVRELAPRDAPTLEPLLDDLFHRHKGNIRMCLRELYDLFAGRGLHVQTTGSSGIE